MKLFSLYTAIALCTAQPHQSRPRTVEGDVWRNKNGEEDLGETKFVLRGYEGERGSSEDSRSPQRDVAKSGLLWSEDFKRVVVGLLHDHPDWTNHQVAVECIKSFPNYSISQVRDKVGRTRRADALRTSRGLESGQRSLHAWAGLSGSQKKDFDRRVVDMVKAEFERDGGGRNVNSVAVKSNVQKKFFEETGRYIPQIRLDLAFSHVRSHHE